MEIAWPEFLCTVNWQAFINLVRAGKPEETAGDSDKSSDTINTLPQFEQYKRAPIQFAPRHQFA